MDGEWGRRGVDRELTVALLEAEAYAAYNECDAPRLRDLYEKMLSLRAEREVLDRIEDLADDLLARLRGGKCRRGGPGLEEDR